MRCASNYERFLAACLAMRCIDTEIKHLFRETHLHKAYLRATRTPNAPIVIIV